MGTRHDYLAHWASWGSATPVPLTASTTVKTCVIGPYSSGIPSAGVAGGESLAKSATFTSHASTGTTLVVVPATSLAWTVDAYIGHVVECMSGACIGQTRFISDNDATSLTVDVPFSAQTDSMTFRIVQPSTKIPVLTYFDLNHTGTAGNLLIESVGYINGALTNTATPPAIPLALGRYVTAGTSGTLVTAPEWVGYKGGDLRITPSAALAGTFVASGFWADAIHG